MKKIISLVLAIAFLFLSGNICTVHAEDEDFLSSLIETTLSPKIKCPAQPTIYCSPRYLDEKSGKGQNLKNGISAKKVNDENNTREFGLYLKFTPKRADDGYVIRRIDFVIRNKAGDVQYTAGFDTEVVCEYRYYWSWNFFPLSGFFAVRKLLDGEVLAGRYTLEIYFNSLFAGSTTFSINK
ncbi:MAG: hypothetical protein IKE24_01620 [Clostridia bacterium]|nr:hypothetical protein [Clostridia bacterium]